MKTVFFSLLMVFGLGAAMAQDTKIIPLPNNDLVYVAAEDRIYVSTSSGGANGNSLCVIDPYFGAIQTCYPLGSEPGVLALSDDGQYLYIGMRGTAQVVQFDLEGKTIVRTFSLGTDPFFGPRYAEDIEVLPGQPHSIAVSMYRQGVSPRHSGVGIFDNGLARANITQDHTGSNSLAFAHNGQLYGYNNETTEFGLRRLLISASGLTEGVVTPNLVAGFDVQIEGQGSRLYASSGQVVEVAGASPQLAGAYAVSNPFRAAVQPAADSAVVYFINHDFFNSTFRLETFQKNTFNAVGSVDIPNMVGDVKNLIEWGGGGKLAFNTPAMVVVLRPCVPQITNPPVITTAAATVCVGEEATLNGPDGWDHYFWSNGATTQNLNVTTPGVYTLALADATGCLSPVSNAIAVAFEETPSPPVILDAGNYTICQGEFLTLTALHTSFNGVSFQWSNGATTQAINISTGGTYFVASASSAGCVSANSEPVTVSVREAMAPPQPVVMWTGSTTLCEGESITLAAPQGFAQYLWSNGATASSIVVTSSGSYSVQVVRVSGEGCTSLPSAPVDVAVLPAPSQPAILQNGNLLASTSPSGNQWFLNGQPIVGATSQFYTPVVNGFYSVQVTLGGCISPMSEIYNFIMVGVNRVESLAASTVVYPNPAKDILWLNYPQTAVMQQVAGLRLYNATGQPVAYSTDIRQISLAHLPGGVYWLQWLDSRGRVLDGCRITKG